VVALKKEIKHILKNWRFLLLKNFFAENVGIDPSMIYYKSIKVDSAEITSLFDPWTSNPDLRVNPIHCRAARIYGLIRSVAVQPGFTV
jgi:hypothetical protein